MSELSYILNNAKKRSLIILDEIGRGTSTYDGLSIAWAVCEYLCNADTHIRTLFATHYHELTALEEQIPGVRNLNVDVAEENGNIVFLHKIVRGSASRSYGIHVARLAGIPKILLDRAENKLNELEREEKAAADVLCSVNENSEPAGSRKEKRKSVAAEPASACEDEVQLSMFSTKHDKAIEMLRNLDLMEITPSKAIAALEQLKESLE